MVKIPEKHHQKKEKSKEPKEENILEQLEQFEPSQPEKAPKPTTPSAPQAAQPPTPSIPQEAQPPAPQTEVPTPPIQPTIPEVPDSPPQPSPFYQQQETESSSEQIQEIAEAIIEEKWQEANAKIGDIALWKDRVDSDLTAIKQEILRTQDHFKNLQSAVLGKVTEYNKNILDINSEMKALEKVMEKIIQPLTTNVKELGKITAKLKKR